MEGDIGKIPSMSYSSICTTSESDISLAQAHFIIYIVPVNKTDGILGLWVAEPKLEGE